MSAPLLAIEDLRVSLPTPRGELHAVRGVSFHVERGETFGVVGESGCGKSLTALALMGLLPKGARCSARRMRLGEADLVAAGERAMADIRGRRIAMIFQEPMTALNPAYTIGNQLTEGIRRHRRVSVRAARERAVALLERVGISGADLRLRQYPHQLSGGLRQRVMIAMALMCEPDVLVADEPTTALDVSVQAQILRLLRDLQRDLGLALVLITHDLGIVARVADRMAVMYAGEVVEAGPVADVLTRPLHPYTRGLLACIPVPGRVRRGEALGSIPGTVPSLMGDSIAGCAFRTRCPQAGAACAEPPPLRRPAPGRLCRCVVEPRVKGGPA
jgi:peptide/nickel transport system ATP-binding protein